MKVEIYDPPMCCSSGICGPSLDPVLVKTNDAVLALIKQAVKVTRYNLKQHFTTEGGCCGPSYGLDIVEKAEATDQVIEKNDLKIFVDPEASQGLSNAIIDFSASGKKGVVIKGISSSCCG